MMISYYKESHNDVLSTVNYHLMLSVKKKWSMQSVKSNSVLLVLPAILAVLLVMLLCGPNLLFRGP